MKVVDCFWEISNIGKKTAELLIEADEAPNTTYIFEICKKYDYVVTKVPMRNIDFIYALTELGFMLMEVQMNISMEVSKFDYGLVGSYLDKVKYTDVTNKEGVNKVVEHMTPDMFSTDRVSLDKNLGPVLGQQRYQNWIRTAVDKSSSKLASVVFDNCDIGFMLFHLEANHFHLLLNGLYKEWQGRHMGIITPSSPFLYIKQNDLTGIKKVSTSISSNNVPVVKLYNRLGFILDSQTYVFVKHNKVV